MASTGEIKRKIELESRDSLEFSRNLQSASITYRDLVAGRDDDADMAALLQDVIQLGAKSLFPALLSAYPIDGDDERKRLLHGLLVSFVRHRVILGLEGSRFETFAYGLAESLSKEEDWQAAQERIRAFVPKDDAFKRQFAVARVKRQNTARYVLKKLEEHRRVTGELALSSGPHHQDSGEAKIRESTAGVSRKPSSDCKACGCSSKHLCGLTAWNT